MKYLKVIGLAVIAALSLVVIANANPELSPGEPGSSSPALALGIISISIGILGATALRLGKSRQHSPSRLLTHCRATAITTGDNTTFTVTTPAVQLFNSRKDRYAPPIISVMAC